MNRLPRREVLRRSIVGGSIAAVGSALAGCVAEAPDGDVRVTDDLTFEPETFEIDAGETVTWVNVGRNDHTVTAFEGEIPDEAAYFASGGFESEEVAREAYPEGALGNHDTFEHVFEASGEYRYFCVPHEGAQRGTIIVSDR